MQRASKERQVTDLVLSRHPNSARERRGALDVWRQSSILAKCHEERRCVTIPPAACTPRVLRDVCLGHELKGLMSYYNAKVDGLHVPLMALIDYRGIRLLAVSMCVYSDTHLIVFFPLLRIVVTSLTRPQSSYYERHTSLRLA